MAFPLALPCPAASLFHDPNGTAFADLAIDGHRGTWPIRSRQFRHWLRRRYYEETGSAASAEAIRSAVDLLEARAEFDAPERRVHIRVAEHDGRTYLDLADKDWRAVQIGRTDGRSSPRHRSGFVVPPACCRFLFRREADRSKPSQHSSIFQRPMNSCWWWRGYWPPCNGAAPIQCW